MNHSNPVVLAGLVLALGCGGFIPTEQPEIEVPWEQPEAPAEVEPFSSARDVEITLDDDRDVVVSPGRSGTVVVQYSDWRCPHCLTAFPIVQQAVERSGAAYLFRNFPLSSPCNPAVQMESGDRCPLAVASLCAAQSGDFQGFLSEVIEDADSVIERRSRDGGFAACLADPAMLERVQEQASSGAALGIRGTPSFYVRMDGTWREAQSVEQVVSWLETP